MAMMWSVAVFVSHEKNNGGEIRGYGDLKGAGPQSFGRKPEINVLFPRLDENGSCEAGCHWCHRGPIRRVIACTCR
jgi:hypothetical protein